MAKRKRQVLDGFPLTARFETRDQIDKYRSGERIACLLCGQQYYILDTHLLAQHEMKSDDYRERFGIPYTVGLCPQWRTERDAARMKEYLDGNPEAKEKVRDAVEKNRCLTTKNGQRPKPAYFSTERTKYPESVWYEFGRRVAAGRTMTQVGKDADMPPSNGISFARKSYPKFAAWWLEVVEPVRVSGVGWNLTKSGREQANSAK